LSITAEKIEGKQYCRRSARALRPIQSGGRRTGGHPQLGTLMKALLRLVLFLDAAVALCVGLVLLASPLTSIFGALQLPQPEPAMYGQLLGVMLIGVAGCCGMPPSMGN